ncbi:MAG: DUF2959 family protein [Marinobacter sp.]|uniref:DUF2959 family protein n=1 Tax=Marinobacter sp. TaxID=50741 RepID=UPI00396E7588
MNFWARYSAVSASANRGIRPWKSHTAALLAAEEVGDHIDAVEDVSQALFSEWEDELGRIRSDVDPLIRNMETSMPNPKRSTSVSGYRCPLRKETVYL